MIYCIVAAIIILAAIFLIFQNKSLRTTRYGLTAPVNAPLRIVHLSDLHLAVFGKNQSALVRKVQAERPDIIVFTGDLIKKTSDKTAPALLLVSELVKCAPTYICFGNHEAVNGCAKAFCNNLTALGATVLINASVRIRDDITLAGLRDYTEKSMPLPRKITLPCEATDLCKQDTYSIVLSHRPEIFTQYVDAGADLVLCGHAHGGLAALPFKRRFYTPDEGLFPRYAYGLYTEGKTAMIVNAGLGFTFLLLRIFNRPEIGVIDITNTD